MISNAPARSIGTRDWQRWMPYAAVAWSLVYAALSAYWAVCGRGFPYVSDLESGAAGPLLGRLGPVLAWITVTMAGIPAAAMGTAMLRGLRSGAFRPFFIIGGALLTGVETPACIAAAETARKGGRVRSRPHAWVGSPCM